jgi:hypothetical protein
MMYVLLYVDQDKQPCYIQGTMQEINDVLRTRWTNGDIDREDWEFYSNWQLLGMEDGQLTPMGNVECLNTPYFEVN